MDFNDTVSLNLLLSVGKTKCMAKGGDCVVKHPAGFATGMALVVSQY